MPREPHLWESVTEEVGDWMESVPDQLAQEIIGDHRPFEPSISHEDQLTYHLEHLHPPELGGQFDAAYLAKVMASGTRDEVKTLAQALDRHVLSKAEQGPSAYRMPAIASKGPLASPARPPQPPRRY